MEDIRHKIGDKVICIDASKRSIASPNLVLNREYIVHDTEYCPNCNRQSIDVGLVSERDKNGNNFMLCLQCDHVYDDNTDIHWCGSYRFRKVEETGLSNEEEEHMSSLIEETLSPALV